MRKYGVAASLLAVSLFLGTVAVVSWYVATGLDSPGGSLSIPRDQLDDPDRVARQLSDRAGFPVVVPGTVADTLQLTRARVIAAFDPRDGRYAEGEWWSELQWQKLTDHESASDHPWFWVVLTQGRELPVPDHAELVMLPRSGKAVFLTWREEALYESATVWVREGDMEFALSVQSVDPLPDADFEAFIDAIIR
jgi:hypothetical protein